MSITLRNPLWIATAKLQQKIDISKENFKVIVLRRDCVRDCHTIFEIIRFLEMFKEIPRNRLLRRYSSRGFLCKQSAKAIMRHSPEEINLTLCQPPQKLYLREMQFLDETQSISGERSPYPKRSADKGSEPRIQLEVGVDAHCNELAINSPTLVELKVEAFGPRPLARFLGEPSGKPINESAAAVPQLQKKPRQSLPRFP